MIDTPWGLLPVADAHVHFFSYGFFASLADNARQLADAWAHELDRYGVEKAALIASVPGDGDSVIAAVGRHPERFYGYMLVDPTRPPARRRLRSLWRAERRRA